MQEMRNSGLNLDRGLYTPPECILKALEGTSAPQYIAPRRPPKHKKNKLLAQAPLDDKENVEPISPAVRHRRRPAVASPLVDTPNGVHLRQRSYKKAAHHPLEDDDCEGYEGDLLRSTQKMRTLRIIEDSD